MALSPPIYIANLRKSTSIYSIPRVTLILVISVSLFGQALRIHHICSTKAFFEKRARELCDYLVKRGYNKDCVEREIDRARRIPTADTLRDKQPVKNRIPFVVTFHPALPSIGRFCTGYTLF